MVYRVESAAPVEASAWMIFGAYHHNAPQQHAYSLNAAGPGQRQEVRAVKWIVVMVGFATLGLVTQIGEQQAERAHPPIGEFSLVGGTRLHFTDAGSGPAIVLIHGASNSLLDFESSIAQPLRQSHRVIAVDRPGHGYSERPDGEWPSPAEQARLIHGLLAALGVESPIIVGHSWSGSVVLAYLLAYPDAAAGGVLIAGVSHPWQGGVAWYNELATVPLIGDIFVWTLIYPFGQLAMQSAIENAFEPNTVPPDYKRRIGIGLSLRPSAFSDNAEDVRRLSKYLVAQSQRYSEIDHPILLITGTNDDIVPSRNHADRLQVQIDGVERIDLENTGHVPHHAQTEKVATAIERFASKVGDQVD